jgi:hypothetical protein
MRIAAGYGALAATPPAVIASFWLLRRITEITSPWMSILSLAVGITGGTVLGMIVGQMVYLAFWRRRH